MNQLHSAELPFLVTSDPPDHTRLRRFMNRPFAARSIAASEARVREVCEEILVGLLTRKDDDCQYVAECLIQQ